MDDDTFDFLEEALDEEARKAAFREVSQDAKETFERMRKERMVLPEDSRRTFLQAAGVAGTASVAGCLGLTGDEGDEEQEEGQTRMVYDWVPKQILKELEVQVAYNAEEIFFRFSWEQPDPAGGYMI